MRRSDVSENLTLKANQAAAATFSGGLSLSTGECELVVPVSTGTVLAMHTENTTKHIYQAVLKGTKTAPIKLHLHDVDCTFQAVNLVGTHSPKGAGGIQTISILSAKMTETEGTLCGQGRLPVYVDLVLIPIIPSDAFNRYVYGFIE